MSTKKPSAWIASAKDNGRKSLKRIDGKDTTYLNDNEEFLIELFNPLKYCVLADIKLNGSSISTSGIVLNPGQRFYLDCFVDSNRKFIFKTYDVEDNIDVLEAISNNGVLEVKFYKETVKMINNWTSILPRGSWYGGLYTNNVFYSGSTNNTSGDNNLVTSSYNSDVINCSNKTIETGRIESGNKSEQRFETVNMDFDTYEISSTLVYILPESRKPLEVVKKTILNAPDFIELIKKLGELHSAGLLTDDEFKDKKLEILSRI